MKEDHEVEAVIELGSASELTRGNAMNDTDVNGGQLRFITGIAED
jgi:hypothetical protein